MSNVRAFPALQKLVLSRPRHVSVLRSPSVDRTVFNLSTFFFFFLFIFAMIYSFYGRRKNKSHSNSIISSDLPFQYLEFRHFVSTHKFKDIQKFEVDSAAGANSTKQRAKILKLPIMYECVCFCINFPVEKGDTTGKQLMCVWFSVLSHRSVSSTIVIDAVIFYTWCWCRRRCQRQQQQSTEPQNTQQHRRQQQIFINKIRVWSM